MKANKPMTGEQLDELMTVAVSMQRDAETDCNRHTAMFAYAVQVAVLELRKVRNDAAALAAENAELRSANDIALKILNDEETMVTSLWGSSIQEVEVKTPATDAFLAEVRAQGVEMFAASLKVAGGHEHPYSAVANEFAAQLRKGVQS
ncbi:hypothetical protein LH696_07150 [Enterobacter asburiae]|uniref:hypothetical protein n=1 Tax=Enterobacter asburiae TaxID=61645 RepID=UPI001F3DCCC6|nr:hypothetical protein [Enterobacter asburiae]MCF1340112.1 hypothetical protein [Enterobacter asburiae]MCQ4338492.1 hypothetical protein [Enterobacter asburiae]